MAKQHCICQKNTHGTDELLRTDCWVYLHTLQTRETEARGQRKTERQTVGQTDNSRKANRERNRAERQTDRKEKGKVRERESKTEEDREREREQERELVLGFFSLLFRIFMFGVM